MESAETVSAAAEAQDQKDPDDVASAAVVVTASASKATAATAAQDRISQIILKPPPDWHPHPQSHPQFVAATSLIVVPP